MSELAESDPRAPHTGAPSVPRAGYRRRVLSALTWNASGELAAQVVRFGFGIALARLLSPHEFGSMAMIAILVQFVLGNADLGFEEALVQKREATVIHESSVFWLLLVVALTLAALQIAAASRIARFYGVDELRSLAVWLAPVYVMRVFGTVPRALLSRQLDFRRIASYWCAAVALSGACAVTLALLGFGVMSLVIYLLVSTAAESLLLWQASRWRPTFELRLRALRELAGFSAYRPAARVLSYWAQRVDQLLIGKFLGSDPLGLYARAFSLARAPVLSSRVVAEVMFPSLALIQDDRARVGNVFVRATSAVFVASVPIALGLFATAEPFVIGVLGPSWAASIPTLRILSLAGLFHAITVFSTGLYLAQGRADLVLRLTVVNRLSTIMAIVVALRWGVIGVAVAQLVTAACNALPTLYFAAGVVHLPIRRLLVPLLRVLAAGVVMVALVLALDAWMLARLGALERLGCGAFTGALAYWAALHALRAEGYAELRRLTPELLGRRQSSACAPPPR